MDIQTNVDMLLRADLKDWHHYENEQKIQELRNRLEQVQNLNGEIINDNGTTEEK